MVGSNPEVYPKGRDWRIAFREGGTIVRLNIDSGTGRVTDLSGAAVVKSDCTIAIVTLNGVGMGFLADRVAMWMRTQPFD